MTPRYKASLLGLFLFAMALSVGAIIADATTCGEGEILSYYESGWYISKTHGWVGSCIECHQEKSSWNRETLYNSVTCEVISVTPTSWFDQILATTSSRAVYDSWQNSSYTYPTTQPSCCVNNDKDGDKYGTSMGGNLCSYTLGPDCDDCDANINPGTQEVCWNYKSGQLINGTLYNAVWIDDNCNGQYNEGCCTPPFKIADPIDARSGTYSYSETDLSYPLPSRVRLVRTYYAANKTPGPFGRGTVNSFDRSLVPGGGGLLYTDSEGKGYTLVLQPDGSYKPPIPSGATAYLNNPSSGYSRLEFEGGSAYIFNASGLMVEDVDSSGVSMYIQRSASGAISGISDDYGRSLAFTSRIMNIGGTFYTFVNSASDSMNNRVDYGYTSDGLLNSVTWTGGQSGSMTVKYHYNTDLMLDYIEGPEGVRTARNTYSTEKVTRQEHPNGGAFTFSYGLINGAPYTTIVQPNPLPETTYIFNTAGALTQYREKGTSSTYASTTQYDGQGRTISSADELGQTSRYTYTSDGLTNSVIDPSGNETRYYYEDQLNPKRLTKTRDALGRETLMGYDSNGMVNSMTMPGYTQPVIMIYNSAGRLSTMYDATGLATTYSYDSHGMQNAVSRAGVGMVQYSEYDSIGRLVLSRDAAGNAYTYAYYGVGNMVAVTDPYGAVTESLYDSSGNLLRLTDARGNSIRYSYTGADEILDMLDQQMRSESFAYNNGSNSYAGVPYSITDREGQTTVYTYGDANRYMKMDYLADNEYDEFVYDAAKRMTLANSSASGAVSYTYTGPSDAFTGLVKTATSEQGTVSYGYDSIGRRASMSAAGLSTSYTYNTKGLINTITAVNPVTQAPMAFSFSYDSAGRITGLSYPNSTSSSYVYNATTGSLDRISHTYGGTDFERLSYTHDVTGMVNSIERLGVEPLMPGVFNATHDSANRVKRFGPQSLVHDKNGNPTQRGETTYSWNQKNQLTGVTNSTGTFVTYMYDALDRRVAKLTNTTTTQYLYDGLNIVAELDDNNNINAWYVMGLGLDQPLARIENSGAVHYYHSDILGSVIALTNSSGTVTTRYNYSPFGETVVIGEQSANPFRFVAKYHDDETGMIIFPYRYYDARMGRFISEDPIRFQSGEVNWYVYASNNPVNNTDPLGLFSLPMPLLTSGGNCGTGKNEKFVPDVVWDPFVGIINFNPSCKNHDNCYEDCNKTKAQCDISLYLDMLKQCKFSPSCTTAAFIYYGAVAGLGDDAYYEAQKKSGCDCLED